MIVNGWVAFAERVPGPSNKVYAATNACAGVVWHSMEGWYAGSLGELLKPSRSASWMFSIKLGGELVQHYPVTACCWASGNRYANCQWWSVELEGTHTMPINGAQLATALQLIEEWEAYSGRTASRSEPKTMYEHREVATMEVPNAGPTACPSGRYTLLWAALAQREDDAMTPAELARLERLERIVAGNGIDMDGDNVADRFGEDALETADTGGWSAFLGVAIARQDFADHAHDHPGASTVTQHIHEPGGVLAQ